MNRRIFSRITFLLSLTVLLCACGQKKTDLAKPVFDLNMELNGLAERGTMIDRAGAQYTDDTLRVNFVFKGSILEHPENINSALAEFCTAVALRYNNWHNAGTTENLTTIMNTLANEESGMILEIANTDGASAEFFISGARMRQLGTQPLSTLNFAAAQANMNLLLGEQTAEYCEAVRASACTYRLAGGFAEYTLTFDNPGLFSNQTQGSLNGRYIAYQKEKYGLGSANPTISAQAALFEQWMQSLGIEGFRFVYRAENSTSTLRTTGLTWASLNN